MTRDCMRRKHVWQHSLQILKYWISTDNQDYQTDHLFLFFYILIYIRKIKESWNLKNCKKPQKLWKFKHKKISPFWMPWKYKWQNPANPQNSQAKLGCHKESQQRAFFTVHVHVKRFWKLNVKFAFKKDL